ncbi:carbohydrate kinase family protein [Patescibacteria group bacterium]|nr:carbohydrate kinase family protein [Patescibacteria group bacterium]
MLGFTFSQTKVCTIGSGTRDVFIKSTHFEKQKDPSSPTGFDACFPLGSKINLDNVIFETGGGATNAAVTFARSGIKTSCICRVGDDDNGKTIKKVLNNDKVQTDYIQTDHNAQTGYSVILLSGTGQRSILVYRGASRSINAQTIPWSKFSKTWFYLTSLGGNRSALKTIINNVNKQNCKLAWNPGNAELAQGLDKLQLYFKQTDILIMNREEAASVCGCKPTLLKKIFNTLGKLPRIALVITDGPKGAYAHDCPNNKTYYTKALPGKRINTTGAGDAFGSAFTASIIKTNDIKLALAAGSINSLGVITNMGAKAGLFKEFPGIKKLSRIKISLAKL